MDVRLIIFLPLLIATTGTEVTEKIETTAVYKRIGAEFWCATSMEILTDIDIVHCANRCTANARKCAFFTYSIGLVECELYTKAGGDPCYPSFSFQWHPI